MKDLKPNCFEDIIAGISLFRPGPMESIPKYIENKNKPDQIRYLHPALEPILNVTYGCLVYQEQVMQVVRELGGYSYGRSDLVRRAMGKKKMSIMEEERKYFIYGKKDEHGKIQIPGCLRKGIPEDIGNQIYDEMIDFAKYAFNKSHGAAYAVLAYQTAYLKCYYPVEFMAALLTSVIGNTVKIAQYIQDCKRRGIDILPPSVNESYAKFTVEDKKIRFGLLAVKNVGKGVIDAIVKAREEKGKFISFIDFCEKVESGEINKRAIESLIQCGTFDGMDANRAQLLAIYEKVIEGIQQDQKRNIAGQVSLFQSHEEALRDTFQEDILPDIAEFPQKMLLAMEKEGMGIYISGHPLAEFEEEIKAISTINTEELMDSAENHSSNLLKEGRLIRIAGLILHRQNKMTRNNNMMAFLTLEDLYGTVEVIVFPKVFERYIHLLHEDDTVIVEGKLNIKEDEEPKIIAEKILPLLKKYKDVKGSNESPKKDPYKKLHLKIHKNSNVLEVIQKIKLILKNWKGNVPVYLYIEEQNKKLAANQELWVTLNEELINELKILLGPECVKIC